MGDVEKLEEARNDAGYLGCRLGDIGSFEDSEVAKCLDDASKYYTLMLDELKEALRLVKENGIES